VDSRSSSGRAPFGASSILDLVPGSDPGIASRPDPAVPAELATSDNVGLEADALVFTSPEGHPLRRTKFRPRWIDACGQAGVSGLHLHDLRGSGATWAATTGATVAGLMNRLGHRTPAVAMRYQHATEERDQAIAERLGNLFATNSPTAAAVVPLPVAGSAPQQRAQ
jgi:integrase